MKKLSTWICKAALMLVLLAAAGLGCFLVLFRHAFSFTVLSLGDALLDIFLILAIISLYIFLCVKIVRFKPQDDFAAKAAKPLASAVRIIAAAAVIYGIFYFIIHSPWFWETFVAL